MELHRKIDKLNARFDDEIREYIKLDSSCNLDSIGHNVLLFRDDVLEGKAFIRSFLKFLSQLSTYAILINDINLGLSESHARYYFDRLASYLCRSSNNNVECMRWHFRDTKKNYFEYGEERHDSRILFDLPSKIINNNMPNTECHSAQLLIIRNNHDSECK